MTDDLVKRLREGDEFERFMLAERAADRIEELEAVVGRQHKRAETLAEGWRIADDARIELEAKLAKVIEALADRIEELEAENRLFRDAVYIDDLTVTMQADDRSKAMVAMKRALDFLNADMPTEAKTALRATLAELTGGKDE